MFPRTLLFGLVVFLTVTSIVEAQNRPTFTVGVVKHSVNESCRTGAFTQTHCAKTG
jgi:hypothetical protein